jgi:hypothetical protein
MGVAMKAAILATFLLAAAGCDSPAATNNGVTEAPTPTYSAAEMKTRLTACRDTIKQSKRFGLIVDQDTPLRIDVDESTWDQLTWKQKEIVLACLAVVDAGGGDYGDRIVQAYGAHSGKELAAGSPGAGTLAPD